MEIQVKDTIESTLKFDLGLTIDTPTPVIYRLNRIPIHLLVMVPAKGHPRVQMVRRYASAVILATYKVEENSMSYVGQRVISSEQAEEWHKAFTAETMIVSHTI